VEFLRNSGIDIYRVNDIGLAGRPDEEVMERAYSEGRVVLTHDGDFGQLAIQARKALVGILYCRPGHLPAAETASVLDSAFQADPEVEPPFIMVVSHSGAGTSIRLKRL